jgi:hypothetical protein
VASGNPKQPAAGGSGFQGIGADPGPAPELPRAVECPKPSSARKHDNDDDVSALPERRRRIWRSLAKPKEARNFKDLKGLKCRYTFRIRADFVKSGVNEKVGGHGKAGEEAYHSRLGVAYGSGGACGVRQNLLAGW